MAGKRKRTYFVSIYFLACHPWLVTIQGVVGGECKSPLIAIALYCVEVIDVTCLFKLNDMLCNLSKTDPISTSCLFTVLNTLRSNIVMQYFRDLYATTAVLNIHWAWHIETFPSFWPMHTDPHIWVHIETPPLLERYILDMPRRVGSGCYEFPDCKLHGANMGPIWGRQDPVGSHLGPMNFAIWVTHR